MPAAFQWDDVQYFLAVVERGSVGAAARWLQVNHSTVLRRIANLERALSVRLFDRLPSGYVITPHGQEFATALAGVSEQLEAAQRRVTGRDLELKGRIRLTAPDTLLRGLLLPHLAEFRALHPQLQLELVVNNGFLNLTQREADVAVRGSNRPPENLVGRRAGTIRTALYAARAYLDELGPDPSEEDHRWVGLDESLAHLESARWMREHVAPDQVVLKVDSLVAMLDAVAIGMGIGWLLCPLADDRPDLVRLQEPLPLMDTQIWVLTHPDLRQVTRIRALTDFLHARLGVEPRLSHD
jgi:DNA-binding transcriptional LysR family regulator